jgi:type III pantothenate kinase
MFLALDARNREISIGFLERGALGHMGEFSGKGRWLAVRHLGATPGRSADEYAILLRSLAGEAGEGGQVEAVWMSSVVPSLSRELSRAVSSAFGLSCAIVGPGVRTGVKIRTEVPSEVGSDLVCAAAAARELVKGPCVVVDFGAAITFSAIGRSGDFLGAAIAPGLCTAAESLRDTAALIPEVSIEGPCAAVGRNTAQSVRAGVAIGYAGLVDRVARIQREEIAAMGEADSPETVALIGTGDEDGVSIFASLGIGRFVPELVLAGVAIIAARATPFAKAIV